MSDWLDRLEERKRAAVQPAAEPPAGTDAMKATLSRAPFSHPDWIFERKLDGVRCIATRSDGEVRLLSRNGTGFDRAGLREDKAAREVVRELPEAVAP